MENKNKLTNLEKVVTSSTDDETLFEIQSKVASEEKGYKKLTLGQFSKKVAKEAVKNTLDKNSN